MIEVAQKKRPGPMADDTDLALIEAGEVRLAPDFEQEYWVRQSRARIYRKALYEEGTVQTDEIPSAMNSGITVNGGTYIPWVPTAHGGDAADDAISGFCGTAEYDLIHLHCGGA